MNRHVLLLVGPIMLSGALLSFDQHSGLAYQRSAVQAGEYWRLFSAHWVHLNGWHWLFNVAAWPLICLLAGTSIATKHWLFACSWCCFGVSAGLWVSDVVWYVGLSGVLHGVLVVALSACRERWLAGLIGLGVLVKLVWEQMAGVQTNAWIEHPVLVDAHLYGAGSGLLYLTMVFGWRRYLIRCRGSV